MEIHKYKPKLGQCLFHFYVLFLDYWYIKLMKALSSQIFNVPILPKINWFRQQHHEFPFTCVIHPTHWMYDRSREYIILRKMIVSISLVTFNDHNSIKMNSSIHIMRKENWKIEKQISNTITVNLSIFIYDLLSNTNHLIILSVKTWL